MSRKRMFSNIITNSEEFIEMPASSQMLYFHLSMNADDDGFVQPTRVMRMIGNVGQDDLKVLYAKRFVLPIADKVIVIKHWRINNTIQKDRYNPSIYQEHLKLLSLDENNSYIFQKIPRIQNGSILDPQYSIDQYSIDQYSIDQYREKQNASGEATDISCKKSVKINYFFFVNSWNELANKYRLPVVQVLSDSRKQKLRERVSNDNDFSEHFSAVLERIKSSDFLRGGNKNGWTITFDWLIANNNNYIKVYEGQYETKKKQDKTVQAINEFLGKDET